MDIKQVPHVVIETGGEKIKKSYEQIMERGGIDLFDCGIHKIQQEMVTQFEGNVLKAVQEVGISIDKPQLERAILDSKSFYDDGYKDGKESKVAYWEFKEFDERTGITASEFCSNCHVPKAQVYVRYCGNCGCKMKRTGE